MAFNEIDSLLGDKSGFAEQFPIGTIRWDKSLKIIFPTVSIKSFELMPYFAVEILCKSVNDF